MKTKAEKLVITVTVVIVVVILGIAGYIGFGKQWLAQREINISTGTTTSIVDLVSVTSGTMEKSIVSTGNVTSGDALRINMPIDGVVKQVFVQSGQLAVSGTPLFEIDVIELQEQVDVLQDELTSQINSISNTTAGTQRIYVRAPITGEVSNQIISGRDNK